MIPTLVFTTSRFKQWIARLARRGKLTVSEIRMRIERVIEETCIHDDCLLAHNLYAGKRNRSRHQENYRCCWRDRTMVNLLRLCYASVRELKMVAGRRSDALYDALRAVEDTIIGHSTAQDTTAPQSQKCDATPYADVGVYDPEKKEPEYDEATSSTSEPCFTFDDYLQFRRLSLARRWHVAEHRQCKALVETLYRLLVVFNGDASVKRGCLKKYTRDPFRALKALTPVA